MMPLRFFHDMGKNNGRTHSCFAGSPARDAPLPAAAAVSSRDAKVSFALAEANVWYATRAASAATASKAFRQRKIAF
jgi:hypothetical protein